VTESNSSNQYDHIRLALFVDASLLSSLVLKQIKSLKHDLNIGDEQVKVYNIRDDIEYTIKYSVIACPTLIRLDLSPPRRLIGELRNRDLVIAFLNSAPPGSNL
jgi:hypothetical protein